MFADGGSQLNRVFLERLYNPDLKKEAEERAMAYLKMRVYEDSFWERILPSKPISPSECDRTESVAGQQQPLLKKIIDKEFIDVPAVTMDFRGKGTYQFVETETYTINFHKIESNEFHITEGELRAKEQPVQDLIKHHTARQFDEVIDTSAIAAIEAAIALSGQAISEPDSTILPRNLTKLRNLLDGRDGRRPLTAATLLMHRAQKNFVNTWPQSGIDNATKEEFWRDGYTYGNLQGLRIVDTVKTHLVPLNTVYVFTSPEFLGHHFSFNDDRFQIRTEWDDIAWKGWKTHGSGIGNIYACAKMTLTG